MPSKKTDRSLGGKLSLKGHESQHFLIGGVSASTFIPIILALQLTEDVAAMERFGLIYIAQHSAHMLHKSGLEQLESSFRFGIAPDMNRQTEYVRPSRVYSISHKMMTALVL